MSGPTALVFVYNAEPGMVAGLLDTIHKTLSPDTYACSLCGITYGALSMRSEWRQWLKAQPWDAVFHHRPEFRIAFPTYADLDLPAVLRRDEGTLSVVLDAPTMRALADIPSLIAALETRLSVAPIG